MSWQKGHSFMANQPAPPNVSRIPPPPEIAGLAKGCMKTIGVSLTKAGFKFSAISFRGENPPWPVQLEGFNVVDERDAQPAAVCHVSTVESARTLGQGNDPHGCVWFQYEIAIL